MRNVTRPPEPDSLRHSSEQWTEDLLGAIEDNRINGTPIPDRLYKRYKKKDVLKSLKQMYSDEDNRYYCCYCESEINIVDYPHIEHRKPKAKDLYPELTFNWDNLHLACQKCNTSKGDQYDENSPILDAFNDLIKEHLSYKISSTKGIYRETHSYRGITTVKHADLDRSSLRTARWKVYHEVVEAIQEIINLDDNPRVYTYKKVLRDKCTGAYGSLIEWLLDDYHITA